MPGPTPSDKPCCDDCVEPPSREGEKLFDEFLHPRDDHGRWTDDGGGGGGGGETKPTGRTYAVMAGGQFPMAVTIPDGGGSQPSSDAHVEETKPAGRTYAAMAGGQFPIAITIPDGGESHSLPGVGDVDQFIEAHPPEAGERPYQWQSRLVANLPAPTQDDILFATREQYEPVKYLADAAAGFRASLGVAQPKDDISEQRVNLEECQRTALAFEHTPDQSGDPRVQAAYDDFKAQNEKQWQLLTGPREQGGLGVKVDFVHDPEPYHSAAEQAADLRDNHHLSIATGLGGEHQASMTTDEYDRFRAVHDSFGHAAIGGGFDRHGEYQAWLQHMTMYTGEGAKAMTSEYHGVNAALWTGDKGTPGTGKTVLLPDDLTQSPWDEHGHLTRKGFGMLRAKVAPASDGAAVAYVVHRLGLDSEWAHEYATPPWHPVDKTAQQRKSMKRDVSDEPRDTSGQWTDGSGPVDVPTGVDIQSAFPEGTRANPVVTTDVHAAALALRDGKYVELDQPRGTSTLLDEIDRMVNEAVANGEDKKVESAKYDLCRASIPGSNLNCDSAVVESRTGMPQLVGVPTPGSEADKLPKNEKGEVDLGKSFIEHLASKGITTTDTTVPAENLRASQRELNGGKVAGMANAMIAGTMEPGAIFTTRDDYVVDGHHRWAATVGTEYKTGESISMPVKQIDMNITDAIREANAYTEKMGIPHAGKRRSPAETKSDGTLSPEGVRSLRSTPGHGESAMSVKRGTYEVQFKSITAVDGSPTGDFEADVSVFGNVDLQGDRVMPGAFKDFIAKARAKGDPIPVVWSHQWDNPAAHIGYVDPKHMTETGGSLRVKGKIDLDNPFAAQVNRLMTERRVTGWSFAYDVHDEKRAKDGANELHSLSITEVGPTLKGANPDAQLISAKALDAAQTEFNNLKAGRRISQATQDEMQAVHDTMMGACERMRGIIGSATYDETPKSVEHEEHTNDGDGAGEATADTEIEEAAAKSDKPDVGEEPEAKQTHAPDSETLLLRHRIEEMRQTMRST